MNAIRRHVRAWASAWLVLQALTLSVFLPGDCCAAHRRHEPRVTHVANEDVSCPIHSAKPAAPECYLRGTCNGPLLALPMAPSTAGLTSAQFVVFPDVAFGDTVVMFDARSAAFDVLLDTPPPRA